MKQCFAVKERHPVLPDRVVHLADSCAQAERICNVKNGDSIKLMAPNRYYVGTCPMN